MKIVRVTLTMAYPDNPTYELTEIVERVANCVADRLDAYALNIEASDRQVNFPDMTEEEENNLNDDSPWDKRANREVGNEVHDPLRGDA